MKIGRALGLSRDEIVAIVGAGGKSSLLFGLAQESAWPVCLTTTTHLGVWQAAEVDRHVVIEQPEDLGQLTWPLTANTLLTGPVDEHEKLTTLDEVSLQALVDRNRTFSTSLLIEADGARCRSLKAPAIHEPVIPYGVDRVVVMAGLSALGQPLSEVVVHRPEIFARLARMSVGDLITPEKLMRVLSHLKGGLKGLPEGCPRVLWLNQADGAFLQGQAQRIALALVGVYDRVVIGSFHHPAPDGPALSVHSQTAGVILAAGGSRRLGQPKQLLAWEGKPFIRQIAENALQAGLRPLYVVVGEGYEEIEAILDGLPLTLVHNPDWSSGQAASLRVGLRALPPGCDSVMFLLSDQPQVSPILLRRLIAQYENHRKPITAPLVQGQRGNPVLFSQETFADLSKISGDRGGRAVFSQFEVDWLPWVDERALMDVDREGDLACLIRAFYGDR